MCGIAGKIAGGVQDAEAVLSAIQHRGPDAQGSLREGNVWLGHTRLSIQDLSDAGAQPMRSSCGQWILSFNGEIYNHLELRAELQKLRPEHHFRGHSDTETLIELIAALGVEQTLPKLNGMFAFALYHIDTAELILVRDPYGIKPVYYAQLDGSLAFASEVKALRAMGTELRAKGSALASFLTLGFLPSPSTLFEGVCRLPAGHLLSWRNGEQRLSCYVQAKDHRLHLPKEEAERAYKEQLQAAIERQLISDVPVGVLLSGGIDSALVASMAAEAGKKLKSFTVGFGGQDENCELDAAAETADVLGLEHRHVLVDPEGLWQNLNRIIASLEEPISSSSALPLWDLVKLARSEVTVVLTGQGSDELWGGYRRYQLDLLRSRLPSAMRPLFSPLRGIAQFEKWPLWLSRGLSSVALEDKHERFLSAYSIFSPTWRSRLLGHSKPVEAQEQLAYWLGWLDSEHLHPTEQMMRIDTRMQLADDFLIYGDKISMAVALEMRVPMLDLHLSSWVDSLPLAQKVQLRRSKIIHKSMAEHYLPSRIVHRKKKGFQVPIQSWCKGVWRARCERLLFAEKAAHFPFLHRSGLESFWREIQRGKSDRSRQLFSILMIALWFRWLKELNEA